NSYKVTTRKKITLEELRKDNSFDKFGNAEKFRAKFGDIDSVTLAKHWTDYVDGFKYHYRDCERAGERKRL
ncbi:MAG: hypothetical protein WC873_05015, partial [Candidatus Gracilibacteria bacterium]